MTSMIKKDKELARNEWFEMIKKSWTWNKLTAEEKDKFMELIMNIESRIDNPIKGDYHNRWNVLQVVYEGFLDGCGYCGMNWRD